VRPEGLGQFKKSTSLGLEPATPSGLQHIALTTTLPHTEKIQTAATGSSLLIYDRTG
jgi:hypothetical protein